jgi:hypothetical protein
MPDGREPQPGGWNRIHLIVGDIAAEVARLRAEGVSFRNDIVTGPGGKQIPVEDPAGNVVELFEPVATPPGETGGPGSAGAVGTLIALAGGPLPHQPGNRVAAASGERYASTASACA